MEECQKVSLEEKLSTVSKQRTEKYSKLSQEENLTTQQPVTRQLCLTAVGLCRWGIPVESLASVVQSSEIQKQIFIIIFKI